MRRTLLVAALAVVGLISSAAPAAAQVLLYSPGYSVVAPVYYAPAASRSVYRDAAYYREPVYSSRSLYYDAPAYSSRSLYYDAPAYSGRSLYYDAPVYTTRAVETYTPSVVRSVVVPAAETVYVLPATTRGRAVTRWR